MRSCDVAIIGGGIVGLAAAREILTRRPDLSVIVLEKEPTVAAHQTGHNSGVLHSGIYYKPGSLKAINCRRGKALMEAFCREHGVPFEICGKVIVAVREADRGPLGMIFERGRANGVTCERIDGGRLRELEPEAAGVEAIHVPEAGIVDYAAVCQALARLIGGAGGVVMLNAAVQEIDREADALHVATTGGEVRAKFLVNCAGLHSDRVAKLTGQRPRVKIVPFRGEYFTLRPEARRLVNHLIYPTPDPAFPFLGVHFTRMIHADAHGSLVECGPNAVPAAKREGYRRTSLDPRDFAETLTYPAFWKMAARHWRMGAGELWRSASKRAFVRALQRLVPAIRGEHLEPAPAGVRAQALGPDGKLLDDFAVQTGHRVVNVLNAPSPAATASLSIAEHIADKLGEQLDRPRTTVSAKLSA
jgi:L-2-hydroxyglutarate oxidase